MAERKEELKSLLMSVKEEKEKAGLKFNIQILRSWHSVPSLHANRWGENTNSDSFSFLGSKITADSDCSHEIKRCFLLVLEKAEKPEIKLPTSVGSSKKKESSRKTSISALLTTPKSLAVWIATNCRKFFKRWEYQTTWPASWEICMQVKKQQLELDMEQHTGSKSGKECIKAVYCHLVYLTCMQSTSCDMPDWLKHKLESWLQGEI